MWTKGILEINGVNVEYYIKHFAEPSQYGIDGGRISKLQLRNGGYLVCNYDRGWDVEPVGDLAKEVVAKLIKKFN